MADVLQRAPDGLVITGDISEAEDVVFQLNRMSETFPFPLYFVLGNHDFYGSSIESTRHNVRTCVGQSRSLHYLTESAPIELAPGHHLIGEDGWGDATIGDYENSTVRLNDFLYIKDFNRIDPISWPRILREQGAESATRLKTKLGGIPDDACEVLVATHVPPFREACWYEGKTTDDFWAPFFVCGQVGQTLRSFALSHPDIQVTVFCGHTHHDGIAEILPNLVVHTGAAHYGTPKVNQTVKVETRTNNTK